MSVKSLEKRVERLQTVRAKQVGSLAVTEADLGAALGELAAARKTEGPPRRATNKPKATPAAN